MLIVQYNKDKVSLQGRGQAGVQPIIKDLCSPSLRFFSSDTIPLCVQHSPGFLYTGPWDLRVKGTNTSTKFVVLWIIKSFLSDPGILYLLSAFINCGTLTFQQASRETSYTIHKVYITTGSGKETEQTGEGQEYWIDPNKGDVSCIGKM